MQFEIYKKYSSENPSSNQWCWRLKDNNKTLAYSADSFPNKQSCEDNVRVLISLDNTVPIVSIPNHEPNIMSAFLEMLYAKRKNKR